MDVPRPYEFPPFRLLEADAGSRAQMAADIPCAGILRDVTDDARVPAAARGVRRDETPSAGETHEADIRARSLRSRWVLPGAITSYVEIAVLIAIGEDGEGLARLEEERTAQYVKFDVFNVFNEDKLTSWNTVVRADPASAVDALGLATGFVEGAQFGQGQSNANYPLARRWQIAFGVRF